MSATSFGLRRIVRVVGRYHIDRITRGFAYPRNGNGFETTPRYSWTLLHGERVIGTYGSLKAAIDLLTDCLAEEGSPE